MVAYLSLCAALEATNTSGHVRPLGTPAEEGGAGKCKLLEAGAYNSADVETGQQCLLLTNTLSKYHIAHTQKKPPGHKKRIGMKGVVILVFRIVIAK